MDNRGRLCDTRCCMSVRAKIILVVLPLLIATLVLSSVASSLSARNGITRIAVEFLDFKAQDLRNYLDGQWGLLSANALAGQPQYVQAAQAAAAGYARSLQGSDSELIVAVGPSGQLALATRPGLESGAAELAALRERGTEGWVTFSLAGTRRVGYAFRFEPFDWYCLVSEERGAFYQEVTEILGQNAIILLAACAASVAMLFVFSGYLTRPVGRMVQAMQDIVARHDLSGRVEVEYADEMGTLAHTFNVTVAELQSAYDQIKGFAFKAVLARSREQEVRNIFQKYVPKDVIERFFANPESMLVGEDRVLAILFSDIRGFTRIAEALRPDQLVQALNGYFSQMVDLIVRRDGIVDKYMGDAIMAFFGAPVQHEDDALRAVLTALDMQEALEAFNRKQQAAGGPQFQSIGVGINYGIVTVGNIGSEKRMEYTVVGDMVNLAARLERLTKLYKQDLLFSESVYREVRGKVPCRLVDVVTVLGRSQPQRIFTARRELGEGERLAWRHHHAGLKLYYGRKFEEAMAHFRKVQSLLPGDVVSARYYDECATFRSHPPGPDWSGVHPQGEK